MLSVPVNVYVQHCGSPKVGTWQSLKYYDSREPGPHYPMKMGTWGPQHNGPKLLVIEMCTYLTSELRTLLYSILQMLDPAPNCHIMVSKLYNTVKATPLSARYRDVYVQIHPFFFSSVLILSRHITAVWQGLYTISVQLRHISQVLARARLRAN